MNNVQPHPHLPFIAASGIDYDVKVFAPTAQEGTFDKEIATEVVTHIAYIC